MSKGHSPKVDEPDINYAFKTNLRLEKFEMGLDEVDAHTFNIIEIIEEEKQNIKTQRSQKIQSMMNNA